MTEFLLITAVAAGAALFGFGVWIGIHYASRIHATAVQLGADIQADAAQAATAVTKAVG